MNLEVILKPCPWCKKTPEIWMPIQASELTWIWYIHCGNTSCLVRPKGIHISIRKRTKTCLDLFVAKITQMALNWNLGNDYEPYEKKIINLDKMVFDQ